MQYTKTEIAKLQDFFIYLKNIKAQNDKRLYNSHSDLSLTVARCPPFSVSFREPTLTMLRHTVRSPDTWSGANASCPSV